MPFWLPMLFALAVSACGRQETASSSAVKFTVADKTAKNIAFVVGSPNDLPGVSRDVQNVSRMIQESNLGYELISINFATKTQILAKAREIGGKISAQSTVLFFYAGHGAENGQLVSQGNGMFTVREVASAIQSGSNIPAFKRFIAVIDACHSGQSVNGNQAMFLGASKEDFSIENFITSMTQSSNAGDVGAQRGLFDNYNFGGSQARNAARPFTEGLVIAASRASEYSADLGPSVGGLFTASLMNAIRSNSSSTLSEILEKAKRATVMGGGGSQTPLWRAMPASILEERFNGGSSGSAAMNDAVASNNKTPSVNPAVTPEKSAPQAQVAPQSSSNQSQERPDNSSDFLIKLIAILMGQPVNA